MKAKIWLYPGYAAWHFVTLPKKQSEFIKKRFADVHRGWGSLPVFVAIGKTSWKTSIFYDKKASGYLLPIKADVRKKEQVANGQTISFVVEIKP